MRALVVVSLVLGCSKPDTVEPNKAAAAFMKDLQDCGGDAGWDRVRLELLPPLPGREHVQTYGGLFPPTQDAFQRVQQAARAKSLRRALDRFTARLRAGERLRPGPLPTDIPMMTFLTATASDLRLRARAGAPLAVDEVELWLKWLEGAAAVDDLDAKQAGHTLLRLAFESWARSSDGLEPFERALTVLERPWPTKASCRRVASLAPYVVPHLPAVDFAALPDTPSLMQWRAEKKRPIPAKLVPPPRFRPAEVAHITEAMRLALRAKAEHAKTGRWPAESRLEGVADAHVEATAEWWQLRFEHGRGPAAHDTKGRHLELDSREGRGRVRVFAGPPPLERQTQPDHALRVRALAAVESGASESLRLTWGLTPVPREASEIDEAGAQIIFSIRSGQHLCARSLPELLGTEGLARFQAGVRHPYASGQIPDTTAAQVEWQVLLAKHRQTLFRRLVDRCLPNLD